MSLALSSWTDQHDFRKPCIAIGQHAATSVESTLGASTLAFGIMDDTHNRYVRDHATLKVAAHRERTSQETLVGLRGLAFCRQATVLAGREKVTRYL